MLPMVTSEHIITTPTQTDINGGNRVRRYTYTTAAESPFQNGICERNHAIVDNMLIKLKEEYRQYNIETLLRWANMAKTVFI